MSNWEAHISNSLFVKNQATEGGAIIIKNTNRVTLTDNTFKENQAIRAQTESDELLDSLGLRGGAIFIHNELLNGKCSKCETIFNGTN
jgi:hypothetical protein